MEPSSAPLSEAKPTSAVVEGVVGPSSAVVPDD